MSANETSVEGSDVVRASTQHLWNLLQGRIVLLSQDVVSEELRDNLDRIVAGLSYYTKYEPPAGDKKVVFPTAPSLYRSMLSDDKDKNSTSEGGTAQESKRKLQFDASSFDMVRKAVAQRLNLNLKVATELLVGYMMYEYKGSSTSYDEIADSQMTFNMFLRDLTAYYKKERYCLLLCTQAILADMGDEEYRFFSIIESIRNMITYKKWCWGLLRSFAVAQDDMETTEILNCLVLLMYKIPDIIQEFFRYFTQNGFDELRKTEEMKMAEGAAMYSALVVTGITDCCNGVSPQEFTDIIVNFLSANFDALLLNPYNIAPVFASYEIFCKENEEITNRMKIIACDPSICFLAMLKLTQHYGKDGLYDRHSLSVVISSSIFEAFESLLAGYDANHFGSSHQAFLLFSNILQHNLVSENFLCGTPLALSALYTDATTLFPLDIPSTLHLWKSLCMSVRSVELCNTIVRGVAKLNAVAEEYNEETELFVKRLGKYKVVNIKTRPLYGFMLDTGTSGSITTYDDEQCIIWELLPDTNASAFEVLRRIILPMAEHLQEMKAYNALPEEFSDYDYAPKDLHAISSFITQFWKSTDEQVSELTSLVYPSCTIMEIMLRYKTGVNERVRLVQDLLGLVTAVNDFCAEVSLFSFIYDIIPGSGNISIVEELILGHEAVAETKCQVTLTFLNMLDTFADHDKCWQEGPTSVFQDHFLKCIGFISRNIVTTCANWRFENDGIRLEVFLKCLKIFIRIYSLKDSECVTLKRMCLQYLVAPSSCLVVALKIEEAKLQDSLIKPTEDNKILSSVMCAVLRLLLRLIKFEIRLFKHLNEILEGMLIRILGRLFRHRLIPTIPTLTMKIFKEVAEHTDLSLLACFGNDEAAFRDVIIQRLEFTSEDINLKIAVLDFLTIISQTQIGIIECFFAEGVLENTVVDLMQENEDLAVSSLSFIRSLFRQSLPMPKSRDDFWSHILTPISKAKRGCKLELITATFHILTFELYLNELSDANFSTEVAKFTKGVQFERVIEIVVNATTDEAIKCLTAIKHFFTLVLGRPALATLIPPETLICLQTLMLERFWKAKPKEEALLSSTLAEFTTILTTEESATGDIISELLSKLIETIGEHTLSTQFALLCLLNKCFANCSSVVKVSDVENTFRILKRLFDKCTMVLEKREETQWIYSVLNVSFSILNSIIEKQHIDVWGIMLAKQRIPPLLIHIAAVGIKHLQSANVVANCLSVLVALATHRSGCNLINADGITKTLFSQLFKFTESTFDESWMNVFYICLTLNTKLLENLKYVYLDEALAFWGLHGSFLNNKLSLVADLTEICVGVDDTEKGYNDMKAILQTSSFILHDISVMMPFMEQWQSLQRSEVYKAMKGVFYATQEICGLLQQPYLLQSSVGQKPKQSCVETKLSPRHVEMQSKLWDLCDITLLIIIELRSKDEEFIEKTQLVPTMLQVAQLCMKALSKAERKCQPAVSTVPRLSAILEKAVVILCYYAFPILDDPTNELTYTMSLRRELCTDVVSLCDGIRRLGIPKNDLLIGLCAKLETKFK